MNLKNIKNNKQKSVLFYVQKLWLQVLEVFSLYFLSLVNFIQVSTAFSSFLIDHTLEIAYQILNFI